MEKVIKIEEKETEEEWNAFKETAASCTKELHEDSDERRRKGRE